MRVALQEAAQARSEGSEFLVVLGTPLGHADFVRSDLESMREEQDVLLDRIPVPNLQAAWLLLSYCAATRAIFVLRTVRRWQRITPHDPDFGHPRRKCARAFPPDSITHGNSGVLHDVILELTGRAGPTELR